MVNAQIPFGGYKQSGIGRDLGEYAINQYVVLHTVKWPLCSAKFADFFTVLFQLHRRQSRPHQRWQRPYLEMGCVHKGLVLPSVLYLILEHAHAIPQHPGP